MLLYSFVLFKYYLLQSLHQQPNLWSEKCYGKHLFLRLGFTPLYSLFRHILLPSLSYKKDNVGVRLCCDSPCRINAYSSNETVVLSVCAIWANCLLRSGCWAWGSSLLQTKQYGGRLLFIYFCVRFADRPVSCSPVKYSLQCWIQHVWGNVAVCGTWSAD